MSKDETRSRDNYKAMVKVIKKINDNEKLGNAARKKARAQCMHKLRGTTNFILILCPRNSERIIYRIYDYQMYVSNEIRNVDNYALPAVHAFERWKFVEYQPVQGRVKILHPMGLTNIQANDDPVQVGQMNDFNLLQ